MFGILKAFVAPPGPGTVRWMCDLRLGRRVVMERVACSYWRREADEGSIRIHGLTIGQVLICIRLDILVFDCP